MIGKTVTVAEAKNTSIKGKQGKVIDETKNTLKLKSHNKHFTIIKDQITTITITEEQ